MSKQGTLKATSLRKFLIFVLVIVISAGSAGFYFGLQMVRASTVEMNQALIDAEASGERLDQLQELRTTLENSDALIDKAQTLYATNANYQTQAIRDINRYATVADVDIADIEFPETNGSAQQGAGIRTVTISINNPVSYEAFARFLQLIEGNIPSMQPSTLKITKPTTQNGDSINIDSFTIRMAVE